MFERFTEGARRAVVLAQEESRLLNHNSIGTEHLLLGLMDQGEGVAAIALRSMGVSPEAVRSQVEAIVGAGGSTPTGHIPFTPRAKKVFELAVREALQLGHQHVGTEHILLGLVREGEGVAAVVLLGQGADLIRVRQTVIGLLSGQAASHPTSTPASSPGSPPSESATYRAAALLRAWPEGPLFQDLLQAGEDLRSLTLEALIACWDGDATTLEDRLGDVVRLAALAEDDAQLARLERIVIIDDALQGVVRLRPRDRPT